MELDRGIGERIAKKRIEKGLSQEELASRVNSSQGLIAKIETGNRKIQVDLLLQIIDVLDTDCDYILRGIPTKYLSAAESTGLSDRAISELKKLNHSDESPINLNAFMLDRERIDAIEAFLGTEEGKNALTQIWHFLACDFTKFYTDRVAEEGDDFLPYNHSIGFKMNKACASRSYLFVGPENFEFAALARINEAIRELKKAMYNEQNDNNRKVNQAKKKEGQ